MKKLLTVLILLGLSPLARPQASQSIVRWVHTTTGIHTVTEAAADALPVNIVAGSSSGIQYTEGDVDATITGTAAMMEVATNTLQPIQGTVADGLLVNLGTNNDVTVTGTVAVTQSGTWTVQPGNTPNTTAWLVTGTGGTFPATQSGTWTVQHGATGIGHGVKTITAAGTDEALAGSTAAKYLTVQAQTDNTGWCAIGASGVDAVIATGTGVLLGPGDSYSFNLDNLADVFLDCTVTGDGVRYTYQN